MGINIGNNNKIKNSIVGNNNNKELSNGSQKSSVFNIAVEVIIGIIVGIAVGFIIYKFGWN